MTQKIFNKTMLITIIVVIMVVASIGGYKYFQYRKDKMENYADYGIYTNSVIGTTVKMNATTSVLLDQQGKPFYRFGDGGGGNGGMLGKLQSIEPREENWQIPSKIKAHWLTYEENQFYEGEFELPRDLIAQRLHEETRGLFLGNGSKKVNLNDTLLITFAPKGKMYVYLTGYTTKLVGNFQGKPIDYDWSQWLIENSSDEREIKAIKEGKNYYLTESDTRLDIPSRKEVVDSINNAPEIKSGIEKQPQYYNEGFFKPVKWQLKTKGQIDKLLGVDVAMVNGETEVLQDENEIKNHVFTSVPVNITLDFVYQSKPYRENFDFDNSRFDYNFLYQRYISKFNPLERMDILVNRISDSEGELFFMQGEKKLEIEDLSVTALER
jgi:predicted transcriptional regulator